MVDLAELERPRNVEEQLLDLGAYLAERGITLEGHKEKMLTIATETASRIQLSPMTRLALREAGLSFREKVQQVDSNFKLAVLASLPPMHVLTAQVRPVNDYLRQYGREVGLMQSTLDQVQQYASYFRVNVEKLKFKAKLGALLADAPPAMSIDEITILWYQDYEDEKKRIKRAKQLIELVINGKLKPYLYEPNIHKLPFKRQIETRILISDFEQSALTGGISKKAPEFSMLWRSLLKGMVSVSSSESSGQEASEPKVIKSKPDTLDAWILWYIKYERGLDPANELPFTFQSELVKVAFAKTGYSESAVIKAWYRLGLKSVHKTRNQKK